MNRVRYFVSPEGALRLQAGGGAKRNPCNDGCDHQNPDRVTDSVIPSAFINSEPFNRGFASLHPCLYFIALSVLQAK